MILSKSLIKDNQSFELRVRYNPDTNEVTEIKSIWLITHGKTWPVSDLMMSFFEKTINEIIDKINWKEIYRNTMEYDGLSLSNSENHMQKALHLL